MKSSILKIAAAIGMISLLSGCYADSIESQARRLGSDQFDAQSWSQASQEGRARMLASFLQMHKPQSLTTSDVRRLLGQPTAYYEYDENPAYVIGPKSVQSEFGKGYVLAFIADKATGRVVEVIITPQVQVDR